MNEKLNGNKEFRRESKRSIITATNDKKIVKRYGGKLPQVAKHIKDDVLMKATFKVIITTTSRENFKYLK